MVFDKRTGEDEDESDSEEEDHGSREAFQGKKEE
jgi:hypothetical protein